VAGAGSGVMEAGATVIAILGEATEAGGKGGDISGKRER
jgi:hypothetical protein